MIRMSSSPIGTRRTARRLGGAGGAHRMVGSPGLGPSGGWRPARSGRDAFDSRLNSEVSAQIARKVSGTIARISWSQFMFMARARPVLGGPGRIRS